MTGEDVNDYDWSMPAVRADCMKSDADRSGAGG
jgi:hypothetical protein